jgi:glucosamine-6-phosphate deaminase
MTIDISPDKVELGRRAAEKGAHLINEAIKQNGHANIIVATGASQFDTLQHLVKEPVQWGKVTAFHLDEYVGMPITHPASFRKYLQERFLNLLPRPIGAFYPVNGDGDVKADIARLGELIAAAPIDVAFVGIGENGHLAFNDPPADFDTDEAYLVVNLDEGCRRQQMGEGWFATLEDVPEQAISMSIRQIMKSRAIIAAVPDERKAQAVKDCLGNDEITNMAPSSILKKHDAAFIYLDEASASLLPR